MRGILWVAAACVALAAGQALALDNSDCLTCHEDRSLTKKGADGKPVSLFVDPGRYAKSVHGSNACTACHADIQEAPHADGFVAKPVDCAKCHGHAVASYEASIHGTARKAGDLKAATCAACHGTHAIRASGSADSPLNHDNQAATCGKCHSQIVADIRESVHGQAMRHGIHDAPSCTDCHADHQIEGLRTASPLKVAEDVCSRCHASERFNARYNLPLDRVTTFFSSYHGMAAKFGSRGVANCASCHGYHNVLPSSDPRSSVNKANMVKTCRKCHPEANENFSFGKIHIDESTPADLGSQISWWVRRVYLLLIAGVIGGMLVHNGLVLRKKLLLARARRGSTVVRMILALRIQHFLLLTSFIVLAVTGFALKYPDSWVRYLVGSSEDIRRLGHRAAAVVMLVLAVYHTVYVIATKDGRKLVKDFCPRWQDVLDAIGNLRYLVFPRAPKPAFARFGYAEKAEYWAVVWGTVIMGLTGLIIWFKAAFSEWAPRWVIDVAVTVHYYEAILAVLAIIVWHFYHVMFDPDVYPMNTAWLDGRVPKHWHDEEHGLDSEAQAHADTPETPEGDTSRA